MDSLVGKVRKEVNSLKDALVGLFQIILLEYLRQVVNEFILFFDVELFLDVVGLFNIVADFQEKFVGDLVFLCQTSEDLVLFALLKILSANIADK